jgi:hypothetical protein
LPDLTAVTTYGVGGASARVRVFDWIDHLQLHADVHDYLGARDNQLGTVARSPGRVLRAESRLRTMRIPRDAPLLLHRTASPVSRGALETRLLQTAGWGVYDFDDALQWDLARSGVRRFIDRPRCCQMAVRAADRVIAGNSVLAEWAAQWCSDVVVIPSCVEPDHYDGKADYRLQDPPRLLWIGSPSAEVVLQIAEPALQEVARRTGAVLRVMSSGNASLGALDSMVERVEWSPTLAAAAAADTDIAIAPLANRPYQQGKCAYKLLQYGALQLPMVGSPVGANRIALGVLGGTAAEDNEQWLAGLLHWIEASEHDRAAAGKQARDGVERQYSYAAWSRTWRTAVGV